MTKAEIKIAEHISAANGLTNQTIAHMTTGYALSTCKRVFLKIAYEDNTQYFLTQGAVDTLNIENALKCAV